MIEKLILLFKIPELRRKLLLTITLLAVYRMGFWIPLPFVDQGAMKDQIKQMQEGEDGGFGQVMQIVALFSASRVGNATIFGLGIMPYISASIIFQLLGQVYPPLEALQKEGESGRRKINEYTRYATVVICLVQSFMWIKGLAGGALLGTGVILDEYNTWYWFVIGAFWMTTGTVVLMWIGEQIDAYGIGNGISLLIMAGIIAQMPAGGAMMFEPALRNGVRIGTETGIERFLLLGAVFLAIVVWVVLITQGQRRIPIQSAKHVRGRRQVGGQRQFLPLRINQAGVMPIIFASSLLMFPFLVFQWLEGNFADVRIWSLLSSAFGGGRGFVYSMCYVGLIYFFCYFWTAITFNPQQIADNLKDHGSFIPGYRPGARTSNYLEHVMVRITYVGAGFLSLIAIIPTLISTAMGVNPLVASFYGGTGLLIVVSVALDLVQKIDSHLITRNYPGLLESDS
ncbi:MAG: preprotein translocase subunit SecY [Planctomycetota bacterium]|nr:preprotein translocase subunit SecY [Planctomycetota bacterium]